MRPRDPVFDGHFARMFAPTARPFARAFRQVGFTLAALSVAILLPTAALSAKKPGDAYLIARKPIAAPAGFSGLCKQHGWLCSGSGSSVAAGQPDIRIATKINSDINRRIRQVSDANQYGREDLWALPTSRGGDCEDFALLKKKQLVAAGIRPEVLLVATVLDRQRKPHAVLVMRTQQGDVVLDNLSDRIKPWSKTGYSFLKMQNPNRPSQWDAIFAGGIFGTKT